MGRAGRSRSCRDRRACSWSTPHRCVATQDRGGAAFHRPGKLRYVIDTHWHWDHTDGNGWVRRSGATIIADKVAVERLTQTNRIVEWEHTFTPIPKAELPNEVLTGDRTLQFDGETVKIRHYSRAIRTAISRSTS